MSFWRKIVVLFVTTLAVLFLFFVHIFLIPDNRTNSCETIMLDVRDSDEIEFVTVKDIEQQLHNAELYPIGKLLSEIDLDAIESHVEEITMVKRAICYITSSGSLRVSVTQRAPLFRVKSIENDYYVDRDREVLKFSLRYASYVPIVTGSPSKEFVLGELYDFVDYIDNSPQWASLFTQIVVLKDNSIELVPRVGSFTVRLGQLDEHWKSNLTKLERFYEEVPQVFDIDSFNNINLEYRDQVVCTKID